MNLFVIYVGGKTETSLDDYNIVIKTDPVITKVKKLFFINLGGYDYREFTELHKNIFVVAENEGEAKLKAKATISHWNLPHKDNLYAIDDCVNVNDLLIKI